MGPGFAAIGRLVHAVTDGNAVPGPTLARANPYIFGVLRIERDRANGLHRLLVKHRMITCSAVIRFPNTAAGRTNDEGNLASRFMCARDC